MLLHIIRKELLDQLLSLRFAIACMVCLVVFLLSSMVLTRDYREAMSTYNMNIVVHRNEVLQITDLWRLGEGLTADRPLNPLNILVRGLVSELTESVKVQGGGRLDFAEAYEQNPVIPLFPSVDFAFIVGIIMSLLALAFSYDAISGEQESGVLKLLMSYSVPRDAVLVGKWIGGYLALIAPFLVSFVASLLLIALFPEVETNLDNALGLVSLLLLALLYLAAIFSLGIFVSCRTEIASTSITVLLLVWVAFILAVPNMAPYIADLALPVPSRESVEREKMEIRQEWMQHYQQLQREEQERTGRANVWEDEGFRAKVEGLGKQMEEKVQKVEDSYMARMQVQTRWAGIAARLSPLTSFELAAFDLSAAGIEQERRFVDALKEYGKTWDEYSRQKREAWDRYMEAKRKQSPDGSIMVTSEEMEQFNKLDLSDYPRFKFEHMPFRERLGLVYVDVLLLLLWNAVFFMLAYLSFLRYDIR